jgi:tetratricopeptide (TPR) repeat protein
MKKLIFIFIIIILNTLHLFGKSQNIDSLIQKQIKALDMSNCLLDGKVVVTTTVALDNGIVLLSCCDKMMWDDFDNINMLTITMCIEKTQDMNSIWELYLNPEKLYSKSIRSPHIDTIGKLIQNSLFEEYNLRGYKKLKLGDYNGCIEDLKRAVEIFKKTNEEMIKLGMCFKGIGMAYGMLNDRDEVCFYYRKAGELGVEGVYDFIKKYCNY